MDNSHCVICKKTMDNSSTVKVSKDGLQKLVSASKMRQREELCKLFSSIEEITLHCNCRINFTRQHTLKKLALQKENEKREIYSVAPVTRSCGKEFSYTNKCLICKEKADVTYELKKHISRRRVICKIASTKYLEKIREKATEMNENSDKELLERLTSLNKLIAQNATYHKNCMRNFFSRKKEHMLGRPLEEEKLKKFEKLCTFINECDDCQFSLEELNEKMKEVGEETYHKKYLTQKLKENYGSDLLVFSDNGLPSLFCIRKTFSSKQRTENLNKKIHKSNEIEKNRINILEYAAGIIAEDISSVAYVNDNYECLNNDKIFEKIPTSLSFLLQKIMTTGQRNNDLTAEKQLKIAATALSIMSCARSRSFLSPLHLSLSLWLHKNYGSKTLVELLSKLGFAATYNEVINFEKSSCNQTSINFSDGAFMQFVFDNADINQDTFTGHGTFHCMGGIMAVTPKRSIQNVSKIPRRNKDGAENQNPRNKINIKIFRYNSSGLSNIKVSDQCFAKHELHIKKHRNIDLLCMSCYWIHAKPCPSWNGYMQTVLSSTSTFETSRIVVLPFIRLQPSDPSAIYSALTFAESQCSKYNQLSCFVTFDQPLYIKAAEIVATAQTKLCELKNVIVRLGGFHLLMSFLGSIGYIIGGSGIRELWETVYAPHTVTHMLTGHAVQRAVRAHLLTHSAINTMLLSSLPEEQVPSMELLQSTYKQCFENKTNTINKETNDILDALVQNIDKLLVELSNRGQTQQLWKLYFKLTTLILYFIRAERTGDWDLHLYTISKILPIFAATGHHNYAKSALLYLQQMKELAEKMQPDEYKKYTTNGYFTIRRQDTFWSGSWQDLCIEQDLMRAIKVRGGLSSGRGLTENVVDRYVNSMPALVEFTQPLEELCKIKVQGSEQHVDLYASRQSYDYRDFKCFLNWLQDHSPFTPQTSELKSLSTGVIASDKVNCYLAEDKGEIILKSKLGMDFKNLHFKRIDKILPLAADFRAIKIKDVTEVVDLVQLFMRVVHLRLDETDFIACLSYELSPVSASLFTEFGIMREATKSDLANELHKFTLSESITDCEPQNFVLDGGFILHKIPWPRCLKFGEIINFIVQRVLQYGFPQKITVVFDGYNNELSTKSAAHSRRYAKHHTKDFILTPDALLPCTQSDFLSTNQNKKQIIDLLSLALCKEGVNVLNCIDDADTLIAHTAINLSLKKEPVIVVANDTDILVLLLALAPAECNITMSSTGNRDKSCKVYNINVIQNALGIIASKALLSLHALTGCDTTSAPFKKARKLL
jgi:hypothetical protein